MTDSDFSLLCGIVLGAASLQLLRTCVSRPNAYWLFENFLVDRIAKKADVVMPAMLSAIRRGVAQNRWRDFSPDREYINVFGQLQGRQYPKTYRFFCVSMSHLRHAGLISKNVGVAMSLLARYRIRDLDPEDASKRAAPGTAAPIACPEINSYSYAVLCPDFFEKTRLAGDPDPWLDLSDISGKEAAHQRLVLEYVGCYPLLTFTFVPAAESTLSPPDDEHIG